MANTPTHNIYYPETSTDVKPASVDFKTMANTTDAAITTEGKRAEDAAVGRANWDLGEIPNGTNLDTWLARGISRVRLASGAVTIVNRPPGFDSVFDLETFVVSDSNGVYRQTAKMKDVGAGTWREATRWSLSGVFYDWIEGSPKKERTDNMISVFGDSQSEASAGTSWPEYAAAKLDGTTIVNYARSGDSSSEILTRAGILKPWFTVEGGSIPASGTVNLITSQRLDFRDNRAIVGGTLAGVGGTLNHVADDQFTFTRSVDGSAVPVTEPTQFVSSVSTNARTLGAWFGGNDFNGLMKGQERDIADHIIGNYRTFVEWCYANGYQPIVFGVTNRLTALSGSDGFAQVQRVNRELRRMYPDIFVDVQAYYVERAIYDMGLTPTAAELEGMGRGEIPASLFIDDVHVSAAAHQAIAENWIAPWLAAKGHAFTSIAQPALPELYPADSRPAYTVDDTAGKRVSVWDAGAGREQTIHYETGWRDVSHWLPAGCVGTLYVNRVGNEIKASLQLTEIPASTTVATESIPAGFQSSNTRLSFPLINYGDAVNLGSFALNGTRITIYDPVTKPAGTIGLNFSWFTDNARPTILPGTEIGTIPN